MPDVPWCIRLFLRTACNLWNINNRQHVGLTIDCATGKLLMDPESNALVKKLGT